MSRTSPPDSKSTVATLFAGPGSASNSSSSVDENVGFRFVLDRTVQILSSHGLPDTGRFTGLLFVPDLESDDPCNDITNPYIPENVTRHKDVSEFGYPIIGFAPWVSPECTLSFLAASQQVSTDGLVFYEPKSNQTAIPPPPGDLHWSLNDQDKWKLDNNYPVYVIPGPAGITLMNELSWFSDGSSHNISHNSSAPDASQTPNARLFTMLDTEQAAHSTPSLWSFILAILGVIFIIGIVLVIWFRWLNARRRTALQQRIRNGELDVENLALNQMKSPRAVVEALPLYAYPGASETDLSSEEEDSVAEMKAENEAPPSTPEEHVPATPTNTPVVTGIRKPEAAVIKPGAIGQSSPRLQSPRPDSAIRHNQTCCAICLDDYVVGTSMVRELPCGHIFHSGCIEQFLIEQSSLCPLCKRSVLSPILASDQESAVCPARRSSAVSSTLNSS